MANNFKSTQIKIVLGYILLCLLLGFSVNYIYQKMKDLTNTEGSEQKINEQRLATYRALNQLYQTEIIGQSVSAGQLEEFNKYQKAMRNAGVSIKELQDLLTDSLQKARLDTIKYLMKQKERTMYNLLQAMHDANTGLIYQQKIESIIHRHDTADVQKVEKVQKKEIINEKSYVVKKKRPNFFKRIAQVFAPPKEDSTLVTDTQRELVIDTLVKAYNPADTVASILRNIQTQVDDSVSLLRNDIQYKINRFKRNSNELNARMNQMLQTFEQEEIKLINQRMNFQKSARQKSAQAIAWVAVAALLLAAIFIFLIERDITRSNHYRQELEKAKKRAEDLLDAREKLMLTITHDIKAPAGSIIGYIDLLTRILKEERPRFYLDNMKSSARHLLNLVSSLLDYHKLESHKMEINKVSFSPLQLFETIYNSYQPLAREKGLTLKFHADDSCNHFYWGDPFRIRQITDNLLSNALKFTSQGSISLQVAYQAHHLIWSVSDTGSGISQEEKENIFKEFTRLKNAQGAEGFGLGLAITQRLVVLMNGDIEVNSKPGIGTTFTISLPMKPVPENAIEKEHSIEQKPAEQKDCRPLPDGQKIKLIFIDDDRIQLDLTKAMLHSPQLQITCCDSPDILFHLLKKEKFDILFTDIQMPALNGFNLLKGIRQQAQETSQLPVVALTARSDMNEEEFIRQGFTAALHKPYTQSELLRLITTITGWNITVQQSSVTESENKDIFNFSALTAFSEDDPEASAEIIRSFIEETQANRNNLEEALKNGDSRLIRHIAHKQLPLFTMLEAQDCLPVQVWLEKEPYDEITLSIAQKVNFVLQQMDTIIREANKKI